MESVKIKTGNKISHYIRNDRRDIDPGSGPGMTGEEEIT